jgi:hypothetical protein
MGAAEQEGITMSGDFHLAQSNIARMRAPLDDPIMAGFVELLEPLNALADRSLGFIWRMQDEDGDATAIRVFEDELILFNLSVWESIEALQDYAYRSNHVNAVRVRGDWFEPMSKPNFVLWWVPVGHIPSVEEARERFSMLWEHGPTAAAFTFHTRFEKTA